MSVCSTSLFSIAKEPSLYVSYKIMALLPLSLNAAGQTTSNSRVWGVDWHSGKQYHLSSLK